MYEFQHHFAEYSVTQHEITLEPPYPLEGQTADFNCTVQLSSDVPGGSITWYLNGFTIRGGSFSDGGQRVQVEQSHNGRLYSSRLRIKMLTWRNSGKYSQKYALRKGDADHHIYLSFNL